MSLIHISSPLTRKGSHEETRRLMDENSVSFQMYLILLFLLSFITLGSESQISVFKQRQNNTQMSGFFFCLFGFF